MSFRYWKMFLLNLFPLTLATRFFSTTPERGIDSGLSKLEVMSLIINFTVEIFLEIDGLL